MKNEITFRIDGYEATTTDENVVKLITYILEKLKEWRITANTYRILIEKLDKE